MPKITENVFYVEKHRVIWQAILALFSKNDPVDFLSVTNYLKEHNTLDLAGGGGYLAEIAQFVPSSANVRHYASIVHRKHMMRKLIQAAESINELGYDETLEVEELLD